MKLIPVHRMPLNSVNALAASALLRIFQAEHKHATVRICESNNRFEQSIDFADSFAFKHPRFRMFEEFVEKSIIDWRKWGHQSWESASCIAVGPT